MIFISEPISFSGLRQSTDTYLQLDASSFVKEHHFTSRIASKCAEWRKSTLQSLEMKKEISFFAKTFI
jgi:hypothetical protein